jgi:hypothetical protein
MRKRWCPFAGPIAVQYEIQSFKRLAGVNMHGDGTQVLVPEGRAGLEPRCVGSDCAAWVSVGLRQGEPKGFCCRLHQEQLRAQLLTVEDRL